MFPQPNIFTLQPVLVPGMIARPMRTPFCGHPRHTHTHTHLFEVCVLSAALLVSSRCLAQTPTPTPTPCPSHGQITLEDGVEQTLDSKYQPYPTGTPPVLKCYRFPPPAPYDPPYPTVLMVPPNVFQNSDITDGGESHEREASKDLTQAGVLVFQVETRLAVEKLPNQLPDDPGTAPEQTDDLKRQILSALDDPLTNGNIYLVGGSAGGCLALWVALDGASTVPYWDESKRSHIKAVVSLSGPADFCDTTPDNDIPPNKLTLFYDNLDDYVGLQPPLRCEDDTNGLLEHASPYWLVTNGATSNPPAIMLYATIGDHVPPSQAGHMLTALIGHYGTIGHDFQEWTMKYTYASGYEHAFHYWHQINDATGSDGACVSEEVMNFLQSH